MHQQMTKDQIAKGIHWLLNYIWVKKIKAGKSLVHHFVVKVIFPRNEVTYIPLCIITENHIMKIPKMSWKTCNKVILRTVSFMYIYLEINFV